MNFRFWISLLGVLLIATSTLFIWTLLRKKESKSHLLPTLGFDALQPGLKSVYIKTTLWEAGNNKLGPQLAREFRRTLFDLQAASYPEPISSEDVQYIANMVEREVQSDDELLSVLEQLQYFRNQKKEP